MMLNSRFRLSDGEPATGSEPLETVDELLVRFGQCTFNGGLYRVHDSASSERASALVAEAFPEMSVPLSCFGFDWLGRQFAVDLRERNRPDAEILMFIPGTGDALDIPVPFSVFHDEGLSEFAEDALAISYYAEWRSISPSDLPFDRCAGYRIPLFLGGSDEVGNLESTDIDVYWSLMGQLRQGTQDLQPGTGIRGVNLND